MNTRNRFLSLVLAFTLVLSLTAPAYAADGQVTIKYADGVIAPMTDSSYAQLHETGITDVESVTVTVVDAEGSPVLTDEGIPATTYTYTDFTRTIEQTLPGGTTYQLYTMPDTSGNNVLYFRYVNALQDYIYVEVAARTTSYAVTAASGIYGENNNQGGTATCTINTDSVTHVDGGNFYSVTFTPIQGQEITKLNLSLASTAGSGRIVDAAAGEVTLSNQKVRVFTNANGSVTVTLDSVVRDMYIVALTEDETVRYDLNTITDGNCSADVSSTTMTAGETKTVKFTPTTGYTVTDIVVTDGSDSKTLTLENNSLQVNGKTYTVERGTDGSATLSVPAINANVFISAIASNAVHYVKVNTTNGVRSTVPTANYVSNTDTFEFVYIPYDENVELRALTITTPSVGTRTYSVSNSYESLGDEWILGSDGRYYNTTTGKWYDSPYLSTDNWVLQSNGMYYNTVTGQWSSTPYTSALGSNWILGSDGRYYDTITGQWYDTPYDNTYVTLYNGGSWKIGDATITVYYDTLSYMHIRVTGISESMEFSVTSYDSVHTVTVQSDKGATFEHSSYDVDDGDSMELTFTPAKDAYTIKTLYITYDGKIYKATVADDSYVRVDGTRWDISVSDEGEVTLDMAEIASDVTVRAETNYTVLRNMRITKSADSHSRITYTGTAPFDSEDEVTVRVYTDDDGYILDKVTFKTSTKSASIEPFDTTLEIDGSQYKVVWTDNTEFSITFAPLPGSLTVTSKSVRGEVEEAPVVVEEEKKDDEDNKNSSESSDKTDNSNIPVTPTPTSETHTAYMKGYGDGRFGPNDSLTRAQAVTLLNRAILGMDDSATASYAASNSYTDVPSTFWGAGAINFASSKGYLSVLSSTGSFNPNTPITRAEFLALLCKYRSVDVSSASTTSQYSDVPSSHWAIKYINYATSQGWIQGVGNSQFTPDSAITRAAICTMVNHILGRAADSSKAAATGATFSDVPLSFWGYSDIFEATTTHQATITNGVESWL